ncbi:Gp19/Gp15/Gp42 family protein [Alloscardovia macacae]|uniref:Phage protein Gp19/Gp15/Gp42 n=1 Tax=Alloscardovia macacae TaxID=1160091 RepID=A0A261F1U3_9BIFI|nr:Gp19/Gp15/Gp42 family protein [Alloscardovia macacae]OZG53099.1 hypothetical protein ALMA_1401 [Alloscardovia macacae]
MSDEDYLDETDTTAPDGEDYSEPHGFATLGDLRLVYALERSEEKKAAKLLEQATRIIALSAPRHLDAEDAEPGILSDIACAMVARVFVQEHAMDIPDGATSATTSVDGFSQSYGFSQPIGGLRLLPRELKLLGVGKQRAHHVLL